MKGVCREINRRESEECRGGGNSARGGDGSGDEGRDGIVVFYCSEKRRERMEEEFVVNLSRQSKHWP